MSSGKNRDESHEITTVHFREEIQGIVEETLPKVSERERNALVSRLEGKLSIYSSIYPHPSFLSAVEELAPGATQQIIAATLENMRHRQQVENQEVALQQNEQVIAERIVGNESASLTQGRRYGFAAFIACLGFAIVCLHMGYPYIAGAGLGTAAIGVIVALINGTRDSSRVTVQKASAEDAE